MKPGAKIGSAPGLGFRLSYDTNCRIKVLTTALNGDSMNTAARIQEACRATGCRVLASAVLIERIDRKSVV